MGLEILHSKLPGDVDAAGFTDNTPSYPLISKYEIQKKLKRLTLFKATINVKPEIYRPKQLNIFYLVK